MRITIVDDDPAEKDQLIIIDAFAGREVNWGADIRKAFIARLRIHATYSEMEWLKGKLQ